MLTVNVRLRVTAPRRSSIDATIVNGTTGDHPKKASHMLDGPGGRDTGIVMVTSSRIIEICGINSRAINEVYHL